MVGMTRSRGSSAAAGQLPPSREDSRPVKVLHLTTVHPATDNRIFHKECRSLAEAGYEVHLAAAGTVTPSFGVQTFPLRPIPDSRLRRFATGPTRGLAVVGASDFDILHFHDPELLPVGILAARRGTRVVWDSHEDYFEQFRQVGGKDWMPHSVKGTVGSALGVLLRNMDKIAAGVVAATPSIASKYSNARTVVVGNEARLNEFAGCDPRPDSRQILFTDWCSEHHLFAELVEAVAAVPEVLLAVAGRDMSSPELAQARSTLGGRLRVLGWLDRQGLAAEMSRSFLGSGLMRDTPLAIDNSANKVFEFAAAGLPSLLTPTPANLQHQRRGGHAYVSTDFTARGIGRSIREALESPETWWKKSKSGRAWAHEHGDWLRSEAVLLSLYADHARSLPRAGLINR